MIDLIEDDCLKTMQGMAEGHVDLTVTSPPYDNLRSYKDSLEWGEQIWKPILAELYRVTKDGGVVVWVAGDATIKGSETGTSFKQALWAMECGFKMHDTMIYQKDNPPPVGGNNRYYQHFEYMFIFSKGKPNTFNPIVAERRNKYNDKRTQRVKGFTRDKHGNFNKKLVSMTGDVKIGNIWRVVVGGGISVEVGVNHPSVMPMKLAEDHIMSWSDEGDTVFDPFMGSGTTGIAAERLNRNFIGVEKVAEYVELARNRIFPADAAPAATETDIDNKATALRHLIKSMD